MARLMQVGSVVRDAPDIAAETPRDLGFTVEPPPDGVPGQNVAKLRAI